LSSAATEHELEILAVRSCIGNRILRHDATVEFDFHIEIAVGEKTVSELQNLSEAISAKSMIGIVADVRLQNQFLLLSGHTSTIDEISDQVTDFGDVGVCRD
jgi:hypothetical protein